jgi:hypothetical protein
MILPYPGILQMLAGRLLPPPLVGDANLKRDSGARTVDFPGVVQIRGRKIRYKEVS